MNDFDGIARFYDSLANLVFGQQLARMRISQFDRIPSSADILILGGGTGQCLEHLSESQSVYYLEKSRVMIRRARRRSKPSNVQFVHADFLTWSAPSRFDVVIAPFFLDVFGPKRLNLALDKIGALLQEDGLLLVTDFRRTDRPHHHFLLWVMHWFFRWSAGLEAGELVDIDAAVRSHGFVLQKTKLSAGQFVFSAVYRNYRR